MNTRIQKLIALVVAPPQDDAHVHFHSGPEGHPAVCDDPGCSSPRLSV